MRCDTDDLGEQVPAAIAAASQVMWSLSGRQFGVCHGVELPYRRNRCGCAVNRCDPCTHERRNVHRLTWHPAFVDDDHPMTVTLNGDVLDPAAYRLDAWRYLVRVDGNDWPQWTDPNDPDAEDGPWSNDYWYGKAVPTLGTMAAAELACEIAKWQAGDKTCRLPQRLQNVSRQGVSKTFIDPQQFLDKGKVGLYLCDLFIRTVNPGGLVRRARVFRADALFASRRG